MNRRSYIKGKLILSFIVSLTMFVHGKANADSNFLQIGISRMGEYSSVIQREAIF